MKDSIIKLNDTLATLLVIALTVVGFITGQGLSGEWGIVGGIGGFVAGALISGVWFVLSGIHSQMIEANRQLKHLHTCTNNVHVELEGIAKLIAGPSPRK